MTRAKDETWSSSDTHPSYVKLDGIGEVVITEHVGSSQIAVLHASHASRYGYELVSDLPMATWGISFFCPDCGEQQQVFFFSLGRLAGGARVRVQGLSTHKSLSADVTVTKGTCWSWWGWTADEQRVKWGALKYLSIYFIRVSTSLHWSWRSCWAISDKHQ